MVTIYIFQLCSAKFFSEPFGLGKLLDWIKFFKNFNGAISVTRNSYWKNTQKKVQRGVIRIEIYDKASSKSTCYENQQYEQHLYRSTKPFTPD